MLTFGSVCSGIEAASVAWAGFDAKPSWFAEIEAFPSSVLAHHYPDVPNLGDMTRIAELVSARVLDAPDVLVGGTPCQSFSLAGLRAGLSDPRGGLTLAFVELADAIDGVRDEPCVVVWENVPGVLSSKDNAFGCFLAGLAGEDEPLIPAGGKWSNAGVVLGPKRAIAWRILDAQYFGVAQRRRRVFVVASARDGFDPASVLFEFEGVRWDSPPIRETVEEVAGTLASRTSGGGFPGTDEAASGYLTFSSEISPTLRSGVNQTGGDRPPGTDVDTADSLVATWWDGGQVSQTLDAVLSKGQCMPEKNRFPAVLQPVSFHPTQDPISNTDGTTHAMGCGSSTGQASIAVLDSRFRVRRLMPVECERLQGFPDGHTLIKVGKKVSKDGPRYKALGNSMAVPVMQWIGKRVFDAMQRDTLI